MSRDYVILLKNITKMDQKNEGDLTLNTTQYASTPSEFSIGGNIFECFKVSISF
ncbi:unnamed protein product [Porites lobata]|uniref:Uncharacterized protein n=1 Tax=Porites lobata TaxID=104759 RepID=A0ABN8SAR7_9CNID|nr:unnamed protein product [Porites lobata]